VNVAVAGSAQINVSWIAATDNVGITGYRVERCAGSGCSRFAQVAATAGTTYSDTGLTARTRYRYRIRASDAAGNLGPYSAVAGAVTAAGDRTAPRAPTGLKPVVAGPAQVDLSWSASTDNVGVTGYRVERCQGTACPTFGQIATPAGRTYSDVGLTAGTTYRYRVRATDAAGNLSAFSAVASVTTAAAADTTAPTAPANVTPTLVASHQISLGWTAATDNVGVTGYRVERCQGVACTTFAEIGSSASTTYADAGLLAGTPYRYQVRAADAAGNLGPYSSGADATTAPESDAQPPTAPGTLMATAVSGTRIDLAWGAAQDDVAVTGYRVERCQGAQCTDFVKIATPTAAAFSDTGLTTSTSYRYVVRATDGAGNLGPYSNVAGATTLGNVPELVAAYSFEEGTGSTVADSSGHGNTGTIENAVWTTAGKYGKALVFNGTSARITVPDSPSLRLTGGMTLEAWVNPSTVSATWTDVIYKGTDSYFLEATSVDGGVPGAGGTFGEVHGTAPLPLNTWTHLTVTYDGVTLRLYANGVQVSSALAPGSVVASASPLQIGGDSLFGQFFHGMIDEVRIYRVVRTPAQLQADANTPIGSVGLPVVGLSPSSIDFGGQPVGTTSDPRVVTLTNAGDATLSIGSIGIVGAQSADFHQTSTCGATLAPAGSCQLTVTFRPTAGTSRLATLTIADNAPGGPHTVPLAGTATGALVISPSVAVVVGAQTQQFTASAANVVWSVDGVIGGASASGTITASGLYVPPGSLGTHTVRATTSGQTQSATATVYVSGNPGTFTYHSDNARTGQNPGETVLTPANVTSATFGKLFSYALDGAAMASPLYVAGVSIPGLGLRNVVYVATQHDSLYAFDADGRSSAALWHASFINPGAGVTSVPAADTGECCDIAPEIGITGTPVIDPASRTLYVVAKTKERVGSTTRYVQRLHALDIATGAEKFGGPVELHASVPGSGAGAQQGQVAFDPLSENQRPALLLSRGVVYIAFGSHGDVQPYHGWVLGYDTTTLQQVMAFVATPNGEGAGVWQANGGPAADADGNIYIVTGDGTFSPGTGDYGDSVLKLSPGGVVLDYFTPHDESVLDAGNIDLGSSGVLLLPDQNGTHPRLLVQGGKPGSLYLLDRDNMGHNNPTRDSQIVQSLENIFPFGTPEPGNYSAPVYFNGTVYFSPVADAIKAFRVTSGRLSTSPASQTAQLFPYPGGSLAISASGAAGGILWAVRRNGATSPGTLHAYDPANVAIELYNSDQAGDRDTLDVATKFSVPLVANGKVFVSTMSQLTAYGLRP